MAIELLGFPTTLGLPRTAHRHGPEALRGAGLIPMLTAQGLEVQDLGDLIPPQGNAAHSPALQVQQVVEAARWQAETWLRRHQPGNLMLTLGGDHSLSLGTLWALHQMDQSFEIVWVDAHGDFNVIETSPTGNPHGMVLSLAVGLMGQFMPRIITSSAMHLWGIRDLDSGERDLLSHHKAEVLTPQEFRKDPIRAIERLGPNVYLSFDIDSVDPSEAPGTGTPVPGGFTSREALDLVAELAMRRNLIAVDLVEFHPDLDRGTDTLDLAMDVALTAVTGRVPTRSGRR